MFSPPLLFFFFNDTATTEIYTLSLHDALPIYAIITDIALAQRNANGKVEYIATFFIVKPVDMSLSSRSEEHTSELQSQSNLVCRLLLEKKKRMSLLETYLYESTPRPDTPTPTP